MSWKTDLLNYFKDMALNPPFIENSGGGCLDMRIPKNLTELPTLNDIIPPETYRVNNPEFSEDLEHVKEYYNKLINGKIRIKGFANIRFEPECCVTELDCDICGKLIELYEFNGDYCYYFKRLPPNPSYNEISICNACYNSDELHDFIKLSGDIEKKKELKPIYRLDEHPVNKKFLEDTQFGSFLDWYPLVEDKNANNMILININPDSPYCWRICLSQQDEHGWRECNVVMDDTFTIGMIIEGL